MRRQKMHGHQCIEGLEILEPQRYPEEISFGMWGYEFHLVQNKNSPHIYTYQRLVDH